MSEVTLVSTGLTGATIGTLAARIEQEIHRAAPQDRAAIKIAIITAMEWYKPYHFHFNQGTGTFDMTIGQEEYPIASPGIEGYPDDLVAPMDVYIQTGGNRWLPMDQITQKDQRWRTPTETVSGLPTAWSWYDFQMYFTPITSQANVVVRMDYVRDVGIPRYYWDGVEWNFLLPESNAPMQDSYSNEWIEYAEELIRQHAKWDLYFNVYDDAENAQKMFDAAQITLGNTRQKSGNFTRNVGRVPTTV